MASRQTTTGSVRSLVSEATPATTMTAPTPSQNHVEDAMSGCSAIDAATVAIAAVSVSRRFICLLVSSP